MYKSLFWALVRVGRPFGGLRPRRFTHYIASRAYGHCRPEPSDFDWYRDRSGLEFWLHPHYFMDYSIIAFGYMDESLSNYIERCVKPGMICLDVGANMGLMTAHIAKMVGPTGVVHSFEPVPHVHERLRHHVERNGLQAIARLHQVALSDETGELTMRVVDEDLPNQGMSSLVNDQATELINSLTIKAMKLDEFAEEEDLRRLDLIKIDIQGAEPLFLEGGRKTITKFKPDLLMEVSPEDLAGLGLTSIDLLEKVESFGYDSIRELTPSGRAGRKISSKQVQPDYFRESVLCTVTRAN